MKQKILSLCVAGIMAIAEGYCGVTLTVPDVSIAPGSTSNVIIYFDLGTPAYTAYQFDIAYPEGISSVEDDDNNPAFTPGDVYNGHSVSSCYAPDGKARFQCFSVNSAALTAQSGTLLILPVKAARSLAEGTYQATISPIEFVQTDATPDRPDAITFNITVNKTIVLDESSLVAPSAATGVNVQVLRTINANSWSTICLPFSMTEAQTKEAFGSDVQLADFTGYDTEEDNQGNIIRIKVNFEAVNVIEANHPYIIKVSSPVTEFSVNGVDINPVEKPTKAAVTRTRKQWSEMIGTYVAETTIEDQMLFISGGLFWYSNGNAKMKGYRAYFDFYDVLPELGEASVKIYADIDDEATGIDEIVNDNSSSSNCYDLGGRKVGKPSQRGVYIVNGKKKLF